MLVSPSGIAHYSATQSFPFLGFVQNQPYAEQNDILRRHHKLSHFCHQHRLKPLKFKRGESEDYDYVSSTLERVSRIFSAPTPGIVPDLAFGYPFLLAIAFVFLPITSATLLSSFFTAFSFVGRKFVLEDYLEEKKDVTTSDDGDEEIDFLDMPPTDLFSLGSSILCTALVAPGTDNSSALLSLDEIASAGVILALVTIIVSTFMVVGPPGEQTDDTASPDKQLMQLWDEQLAEQSHKQAQKKK